MKKFVMNEVISYLREPFAFVFSVILPIALIFVYGESFGKYSYNEVLSGYDLSVIFNIIFLISNLGCMGLIQSVVEKKGTYCFKRQSVLPISEFQRFLINIFSTVIVAVIISITVVVINFIAYDISLSINVGFLLAYVIVLFNFFSLGYAISLIELSPKTIQAIGLFVFFVCMFLSGLVVPFDDASKVMCIVSQYSPFSVALKLFTYTQDSSHFATYKNYLIATAVYTLISIFFLFMRTRSYRENRTKNN